jgi:small-conductance mechanosensitive channel
VTFLLPRATGDSVRPQLITAEIRGLFRLGAEPDHALAFMDVDALLRGPGIAEAQLRLVLDDLFRAPAVTADLEEILAGQASVSDWTLRYGELFDAVGMEKTMMGLLLGLIVAIAVFNIVASLAMVVDEKRGAIAILRTLGASRLQIVRIFVLQGAVVGVVGIGVGLGLQRTISNFAAGFTLLADKSIKPGDAIELDGTFGWVTAMQGRYVSIRTRDGTELLIPNDHFITNGVINWSRSDNIVRLHAPFGVSYGQRDMRKVQEIAQEAARTVSRVVPDKDPVCNLMEFGDSSVNFDLRFWISDPQNGLANVRSEVYLAVWEALHEHDIEIPFPQRDVYIKEFPGRAADQVASASTAELDETASQSPAK